MAMRSAACAFNVLGLALVAGLALPACRSGEKETAPPTATGESAEGGREERADRAMTEAETLAERRVSLASEYFESARANFDAGRLEEARRELARVLEMTPDNAEARRLFERTESLLGYRAGERAEVFASARDRELVRIQEAKFRAENLIVQGRYEIEKGEYESAIRSLEDAAAILEWFPYELDTSLDENQVKGLLEQAKAGLERKRQAEALRLAEAARAERAAEEEKARTDVIARKGELFSEADKQFGRGNFVVAEKLCDEILRLDPDDLPAKELKEISTRARHSAVAEQNHKDLGEQWKRVMEDIKAKTVPQAEIITFPDNWDEISRRKPREFRPAEAVVSAEEQAIRNRLSGILVSPEFTDAPLTQVADFFHQISGVNIVVTKAVLDKLSEDERTVTFTANRLPLSNVLTIIAEIKALTWNVEDGVVKITTPEDAQTKVQLQMLDIRDLVTPINDFPGEEITLRGSEQIEVDEEEDTSGELTAAIQADRLIQLIQENIAPNQWDAPASIENKEGTLVIKQTPAVLDQIQSLLADLRKTTGLMVAIDSRFLTVEDNFLEDIGVDLRGLGDDSGGSGVPGRGDDRPLGDFGQPGSGFGTPNQPFGLGTGNDSGVFYDVGNNGDVRSRVENLFDSSLGSPDTLTRSGGTTIQYTYLDDVQIEAILRATRKGKRTNSITAPRILVANNERASMSVITEVSYIKDFDVEIAQAAVIADPIVDLIREGVILDVKPVVSSDRKYVTLELRPTVSTLRRPIPTFQTTLGSGPPVAIQTPSLNVQRIRTTVTMPDRSTLLIGGLTVSEDRLVESGVPFLNKIPIVNFLLGRKGQFSQKRNLIILLRAEIVIFDERQPKFGSQLRVARGAR